VNCSWCGLGLPATLEGVAIDHIIPRARGGPDTRWNKQLLHAACNSQKSDRLTPAAEALAFARGVSLREPNVQRRTPSNRECPSCRVLFVDLPRHMAKRHPDGVRGRATFVRRDG
jgi:5-methylcytosine-specific restriction endonuclease McrA